MHFVSKILQDLRDVSYPQRKLTSFPSYPNSPYSTPPITCACSLCRARESWSPLCPRLQF